MKRILYSLTMLMFGLMFIATLIFFYWQVYPFDPIEFYGNATVTPAVTHVGDIVTYTNSYCKKMNLVSTVNRQFVDGVIYNMPSVKGANPVGCRKTSVLVSIPNVPPGKYHFRIVYEYEVAPFRKIQREVSSEPIIVLEATKSATLLE